MSAEEAASAAAGLLGAAASREFHEAGYRRLLDAAPGATLLFVEAPLPAAKMLLSLLAQTADRAPDVRFKSLLARARALTASELQQALGDAGRDVLVGVSSEGAGQVVVVNVLVQAALTDPATVSHLTAAAYQVSEQGVTQLASHSVAGRPSPWVEAAAAKRPQQAAAPPGEVSGAGAAGGEEWLFCTHKGKGRSKKRPMFQWTGKLRPHPISPYRTVPSHIARPDYATTGYPASEIESKAQQVVPVLSAKDIAGLRAACRLGRTVLDACVAAVRPGITTDELDAIAHRVTIEGGGYPSPLNYVSFPKSCCTSVNEVICHGIPDARPLEDGDIVNLDISVFLNGYHGDLNETVLVGNVDEAGRTLVRGALQCLEAAIAIVKPGTRFRDVGDVISSRASRDGLSVVRTYCGHGIGEHFHCAPNIPHYANNKAVGVMKAGTAFTIEPMINQGHWRDTTWPDGWTSVTSDGKRSAQFEHTLLVTETGVEVLTARTPDSPAVFPFVP